MLGRRGAAVLLDGGMGHQLKRMGVKIEGENHFCSAIQVTLAELRAPRKTPVVAAQPGTAPAVAVAQFCADAA